MIYLFKTGAGKYYFPSDGEEWDVESLEKFAVCLKASLYVAMPYREYKLLRENVSIRLPRMLDYQTKEPDIYKKILS